MIRNYLRSIWQHLRRHPGYSLINLAGLFTGLFASMLLALYVHQELGYEAMHSKAVRIVRIDAHISNANGYDQHFARVPFDWINALPEELPQVLQLIRFQNYERRKLRAADQLYLESYAFSTDARVFEVFDFPLLAGNPATALRDPYSVVISAGKAQSWFGGTAVLGREIEILHEPSGQMERYKITGVMQDLPANTHLPVNLLTSFPGPEARTGWAYCYVLLHDPADLSSLQGDLQAFAERHQEEPDTRVALGLMPLADIHLHSDLAREIKAGGNAESVWFFAVVAVLILIVAGFNFAQLVAARMLDRYKEAGVRRVLGSSGLQLLGFYALEALSLSLFAGLLAVGLLWLLLPFLSTWLGLRLEFQTGLLMACVLAASLLLAFIAALYPAWFFSHKLPIASLRGTALSGSFKPGQLPALRHALVTFQFVLCIALLAGTLVSQSQFHYLLSKDLGYDATQVLAIREIPHAAKAQLPTLQEKLRNIAGVSAVSAVMEVPGREIRDTGPVTFYQLEGQPSIAMNMQVVDARFIELMGMELVAGESFASRPELQRDFPAGVEDLYGYLASAKRGYILNEEALRLAGIRHPAEVIGQEVDWSIGDLKLDKGPVIGVLKDYHQSSLRDQILPTIMVSEPLWYNNIILRLEAKEYVRIREAITQEWQSLYPDLPIDMVFLESLFEQLYAHEQQQVALLRFFSALAIIITILGMTGMLSFMSQRRSREFALRRVLGARQWDLSLLLGRQLLLFAALALFIALPLSWYFLSGWLEGFAYSIQLEILPFALAGLALLLLVVTMVWWQAQKASNRKPAALLQSE